LSSATVPFAATVTNEQDATWDVQASASFLAGFLGGTFINHGTIKKTGDAGTSVIAEGLRFGNVPKFSFYEARIEVYSGSLINEAGGVSTGGGFWVAPGATFDLTGGKVVHYWGRFDSGGGGTIALTGGTLVLDDYTTFLLHNLTWTSGTIDT